MWSTRSVFDVKLGQIMSEQETKKLLQIFQDWFSQSKRNIEELPSFMRKSSSQKQYSDLMGNEIYEKRPYSN
jgi:hypothetical protein